MTRAKSYEVFNFSVTMRGYTIAINEGHVMTETTAEQQDGLHAEGRRFDLVGIAAPVFAMASLVLAVVTSDLDAKFTHLGLTLMLVCMAAHIYHLRGKPAAERPPVKVSPTSLALIVGFCAGTVLCGLGMTGPFGLAMQYIPTILAILIGAWFQTPAGQAKRAEIARRS